MGCTVGKIFNAAARLLSLIVVEPVVIFFSLAMQIYFTTLSTGLYQVICTQLYYSNFDPKMTTTVDCQHAKSMNLSDQNKIQQSLAFWSILIALSHFLTGMVSTVLLGAWGDTCGRKTNFLLGLTGILVSVAPTPIFFEFKSVSLWFLALFGLIGGCLGYMGIVVLSSYAYLCDTILDKDDLSVRLTILSAAMSLAGIGGSFLCGAMLDAGVNLSWICIFCVGLLTAAFFYVLCRMEDATPAQLREKALALHKIGSTSTSSVSLRILGTDGSPSEAVEKISPCTSPNIIKKLEYGDPQIPAPNEKHSRHKPHAPSNEKHSRPESHAPSNEKHSQQPITPAEKPRQNLGENFRSTLAALGDILKGIYRTYAKPRPNHERSFLLATSFALFLYMAADLGLLNSIMNHYVFREPFYWTNGAQLGYWRAAKGTINFAGNLCGIWIFKNRLKMRDTSIMLISIASAASELIIIAFSTSGWMLYVAISVGLFGNLFLPVMVSMISQIVHYDEIGKSFTAHGIASSLAFMCSALVFNAVYKMTLNFMPGFVFLFGASVVILCFFIILWIHAKQAR